MRPVRACERDEELELGRRELHQAIADATRMRGTSSVTRPRDDVARRRAAVRWRRKTARIRATSSFGLNGFVT